MLREPVQLPPSRASGVERLAERTRELAEDPDLGAGNRVIPTRTPLTGRGVHPERITVAGPQQRPRVLRGRTLRGRLLGGPDDLLDLIVVHAGPGDHADGGLFAAPADGDNCQLA